MINLFQYTCLSDGTWLLPFFWLFLFLFAKDLFKQDCEIKITSYSISSTGLSGMVLTNLGLGKIDPLSGRF